MDELTRRAIETYHSLTLDLAEELILRGDIEVATGDHLETLRRAIQWWKKHPDGLGGIPASRRYLRELHERAKSSVADGDNQFALLFYATAIEHVVNEIIVLWHRREHASEDDAKQAIMSKRGADARIAFWSELFGADKSLDADAQTTLRKLSHLRNEVVHYKWPQIEFTSVRDGVAVFPEPPADLVSAEQCDRVLVRLFDFRIVEFFDGFDRRTLTSGV